MRVLFKRILFNGVTTYIGSVYRLEVVVQKFDSQFICYKDLGPCLHNSVNFRHCASQKGRCTDQVSKGIDDDILSVARNRELRFLWPSLVSFAHMRQPRHDCAFWPRSTAASGNPMSAP